jgi:hypothetical protein
MTNTTTDIIEATTNHTNNFTDGLMRNLQDNEESESTIPIVLSILLVMSSLVALGFSIKKTAPIIARALLDCFKPELNRNAPMHAVVPVRNLPTQTNASNLEEQGRSGIRP